MSQGSTILWEVVFSFTLIMALPRVCSIGKWRAASFGTGLVAAELLLMVYTCQPILLFWTYYRA